MAQRSIVKYDTRDEVKVGFGIEISYEALVQIIRERFPDLLDWDNIVSLPKGDVSDQTLTMGLYWAEMFRYPPDDGEEVARKPVGFRMLGERAPIPVVVINTPNLFVGHIYEEDADPRCGYRTSTLNDEWRQCVRGRGHDGDHKPPSAPVVL